MTTSPPKPGERIADVRFDDDTMSVDLADDRTITVPLAWYRADFMRRRSSTATERGLWTMMRRWAIGATRSR